MHRLNPIESFSLSSPVYSFAQSLVSLSPSRTEPHAARGSKSLTHLGLASRGGAAGQRCCSPPAGASSSRGATVAAAKGNLWAWSARTRTARSGCGIPPGETGAAATSSCTPSCRPRQLPAHIPVPRQLRGGSAAPEAGPVLVLGLVLPVQKLHGCTQWRNQD